MTTYWPSASHRLAAITPAQLVGGAIASVVVALQLRGFASGAPEAVFAFSRSRPLAAGAVYVALATLTLAHTRDDVKAAPPGSLGYRVGKLSATVYLASVVLTFMWAIVYMWFTRWPIIAAAPNVGIFAISLLFHVLLTPVVATLVALASPAFMMMMALASFMALLPGMSTAPL